MCIYFDFSSYCVDLIEEGFDVVFWMGKLEDVSFVVCKFIEICMSMFVSFVYFILCG